MEAVDEVDPSFLEHPPRLTEPGVEDLAHRVESPPDWCSHRLNQVDVLGVPRRRAQVELVQGGSTAPRQGGCKLAGTEDVDRGPAEDDVLLDLLIRRPRRDGAPFGNEVPRDQRSGSTSKLMATFHREDRLAPVRDDEASSAATLLALLDTRAWSISATSLRPTRSSR